jgi:hypothetical protein
VIKIIFLSNGQEMLSRGDRDDLHNRSNGKIAKILSRADLAPMLENLPAFTRFFACGVILMGVDQNDIASKVHRGR